MQRFESDAEILRLPCPGLVEYVEQGVLEGAELEAFLTNLFEPYQSHRWIVSCLAARIIRLCGRQSRSFSEPECRSLTAERGPRGRQNAGLKIAVCAAAERSREPWNCATALRRSR